MAEPCVSQAETAALECTVPKSVGFHLFFLVMLRDSKDSTNGDREEKQQTQLDRAPRPLQVIDGLTW